jgi:hypothetical protein
LRTIPLPENAQRKLPVEVPIEPFFVVHSDLGLGERGALRIKCIQEQQMQQKLKGRNVQ